MSGAPAMSLRSYPQGGDPSGGVPCGRMAAVRFGALADTIGQPDRPGAAIAA